jgi:methyltransferase FkbM-like protein
MEILPQPLASFARNITSQNGEDGMLDEIFRRIGEGNGWCLEVGAWDGEHFSNTCAFWRDRGWSAALVECNDESFAGLKEKTRAFPKVHAFHRRLTISGPNSLEAILQEAGAPQDIDLVSIDVDGNDYHIFGSLQKFVPRVVVLEHNPTIPPEVEVVQKPDAPRARFGASAGALVDLARRKGYGLAASTWCNCIFVREEEFPRLAFAPIDITQTFSRERLVYLMNCYNGKLFLNQPPVYSGIKRSFTGWLRNSLWPAKRAAWPKNTIPVICQRAMRDRQRQ